MPELERVADLEERQRRLESENRDQWQHLHEIRSRVSAAEQGVKDLRDEVHNFRVESREDARSLTGAIQDLGMKLGNKADHDSPRQRRIEDILAMRRGSLRTLGWIVGVGIPSGAAIAGGLYYASKLLWP